MALHIDISRIANHETVCLVGDGESRKYSDTTGNLAFYTMTVDIGEITDAMAMELVGPGATTTPIAPSGWDHFKGH